MHKNKKLRKRIKKEMVADNKSIKHYCRRNSAYMKCRKLIKIDGCLYICIYNCPNNRVRSRYRYGKINGAPVYKKYLDLLPE